MLDLLGRATVEPEVEPVGRGGPGQGAERESGQRAGRGATQK
jgi:hypothetical protein